MNVLCSLISFTYFVTLLKVMATNANSTLILSIQQDYFAASETVKQSDGFQVAFGFAPYDKSAGVHYFLSANTQIFGEGEPINFAIERCTEEELASFYPIKKS